MPIRLAVESEPVAAMLRAWVAEGKPDEWHTAPVLADAVEEAESDGVSYAAHNLHTLRRGRMVAVNGLCLFDDEEVQIACGELLPSLTGYNWREAFGYAGEAGPCNSDVPRPALPGDDVPVDPFSRRDVAEVLAMIEGEYDGKNWLCVGRLRDGRWFALDAGCDYTGWD